MKLALHKSLIASYHNIILKASYTSLIGQPY